MTFYILEVKHSQFSQAVSLCAPCLLPTLSTAGKLHEQRHFKFISWHGVHWSVLQLNLYLIEISRPGLADIIAREILTAGPRMI